MIYYGTFQAGRFPAGDLTIKVDEERPIIGGTIERHECKLNLTESVISTCGPTATTYTVMMDRDPLEVRITPGSYDVMGPGLIPRNVIGDVRITLRAYTGVRLTDTKILTIRPCRLILRERDRGSD